MRHRPWAVIGTSLVVLTVLMGGCADEGPVKLLTDESLSLALPPSLEAWPTTPGDGYWTDAQMSDGREALLHVGPRGADGAMALAETGWRTVPFPPATVRSACGAFLELIAANMQPAGAGASSRAALEQCVKNLHPGEDVARSWPITLEDGTMAQMSVTMQSQEEQGEYWVTISASEQ